MKTYLYLLATDQARGISAEVLKGILWALSKLYCAGVRLVVKLYQIGLLKRAHLNKPVISVGNITLGGVGKTPMIIYLAQYLEQRGWKPVILTRGYMAGVAKEGSDEACMMESMLEDIPVLAGADRIKNAQDHLRSNEADVFLLDDGFQHWRLHRDLDIVAIDTINPWGNKQVLPRGILREPLSALKRADVFLLTKTDMGQSNIKSIEEVLIEKNKNTLIVKSIHQPEYLFNALTQERMDLSFIQDQSICTFCSIGSPESFKGMLTHLGAKIQGHQSYRDHHLYGQADIAEINQYCLDNQIRVLVTTQKDFVKLKPFMNEFDKKLTVFVLSVSISITSEKNEFLQRINNLLHR